MSKARDDRLIKDIIKRYGDTIDLKGSPYLIVEILRQYGPRIDGGLAATCAPPGGTPKPPDPLEMLREIKAKVTEIDRLYASLEKTLKATAVAGRKAKAK